MIISNAKLKHKANKFKISIYGKNILKTDTVHYFGLHLQNDLNSKTHINYVYKNISSSWYYFKS